VPFSYVQYPGNGSTVTFTVPFPYLLRAHVKLYYGLSLQSGGYTQLLADGVNYTWTSATQVQLSAAPVVGQTLSIRRETPTTSRLVDWNDGSALTSDALDTADLQNFYAIQEHKDYIEVLGINPNTNVTDGSITANKLSSDAVTTIKIQDGAVTSGKIQDGAIVDADVNGAAGIAATKLSFTQAGASTVARSIDSRLKDRIHVKDLGCACNGIADDGATLNAAIFARYGGLATSQSQEYVEIYASAGDVLRFATPVTVRQNRIRFVGNGARITCIGQYAFDFTQDGVGNINEDGGVIGWKITGATLAAIRGRACAFTRIENNWFTGNNAAIDLQAVGAIIRDNYLRGNTGAGITLQSAVVVGGTRAESQRCVVEQNRVYLNGGIGLFLKDGGGHFIGGNDLEVNTSVELLVRSSFGNYISGLYCEPRSGIPIIQIDNASTDVPGRTSESNQIIGGCFGGGANFDINIAGGNSTVVTGVRFGTGNVNISAGVTNTVLLPCNGVAPTITNNGSRTLNMTEPGKIRMFESTANRVLIDATEVIGGVISGPDSLLHLAGIRGISTTQTRPRNLFGFVDISGASTSAAVTFATAEADQAYGAFFGVWHTAGTPASGSEAAYMTARATTGFTVNLRTAPGAGNTVRVHWMIVR
jgi:hypothetical protein